MCVEHFFCRITRGDLSATKAALQMSISGTLIVIGVLRRTEEPRRASMRTFRFLRCKVRGRRKLVEGLYVYHAPRQVEMRAFDFGRTRPSIPLPKGSDAVRVIAGTTRSSPPAR